MQDDEDDYGVPEGYVCRSEIWDVFSRLFDRVVIRDPDSYPRGGELPLYDPADGMSIQGPVGNPRKVSLSGRAHPHAERIAAWKQELEGFNLSFPFDDVTLEGELVEGAKARVLRSAVTTARIQLLRWSKTTGTIVRVPDSALTRMNDSWFSGVWKYPRRCDGGSIQLKADRFWFARKEQAEAFVAEAPALIWKHLHDPHSYILGRTEAGLLNGVFGLELRSPEGTEGFKGGPRTGIDIARERRAADLIAAYGPRNGDSLTKTDILAAVQGEVGTLPGNALKRVWKAGADPSRRKGGRIPKT